MQFSIVICTYNNQESLRGTLGSMAALRVPPDVTVELCVVDNNSSDATAKVCAEASGSLPMAMRYFFESAQGLSHARNRGLREGLGEFIIYTDDDVVVEPDWLERYANSFLQLSADAVYGRVVPEWRGREPWFFTPHLRAAYALLDYGPTSFWVSELWQEFFGANFAVRKSLLQQVGGFDVRLGRTKGSFFIGEERKVFLHLLDLNARIFYDAGNYVHHVIAESRKDVAFLRRYFRDIAASHVAADTMAPRRWLGFMPGYRWRELLTFFALLPIRALSALFSHNAVSQFLYLELRSRTLLRMVTLYWSLPSSSKLSLR